MESPRGPHEGQCEFSREVGDDSPDVVKSTCQGTVRWAVDHLKRDYFKRDPNEIITIWLFKDELVRKGVPRGCFDLAIGGAKRRRQASVLQVGRLVNAR